MEPTTSARTILASSLASQSELSPKPHPLPGSGTTLSWGGGQNRGISCLSFTCYPMLHPQTISSPRHRILSSSLLTCSLKTLVVGSDLELNVNVTVSNDGEDSYGTTVSLLYPVGLSFRRVAEGQILLRGKEEVSGLGSTGPCTRFKAQAGGSCLAVFGEPRDLHWS